MCMVVSGKLVLAPLVGNRCVDSGDHVHVVLPQCVQAAILFSLSTRAWINLMRGVGDLRSGWS